MLKLTYKYEDGMGMVIGWYGDGIRRKAGNFGAGIKKSAFYNFNSKYFVETAPGSIPIRILQNINFLTLFSTA
jgi:hypothetical protein